MKQSGTSAAGGMIWTGVVIFVIGGLVWLTNTQVGYDPTGLMAGPDDTKPHLQSIGSGLVLIGAIIAGLGWATQTICKQIASVAVERRNLDNET